MKKNKNILYLSDDYIFLYSHNLKKMIKYKLPNNVLKNGKVANTKLFIANYKKFMHEYKLNNNLLGDKITIIVNPSYTKTDIDLITNLFQDLAYRKVQIVNEMKLYNLNSSNAYLNYNNEYFIFSYLDYYKVKHSYLLPTELFTESAVIELLSKLIKKRNVFCFGLKKDLAQFILKFEAKTSNIVYTFQNNETYLLDTFTED